MRQSDSRSSKKAGEGAAAAAGAIGGMAKAAPLQTVLETELFCILQNVVSCDQVKLHAASIQA